MVMLFMPIRLGVGGVVYNFSLTFFPDGIKGMKLLLSEISIFPLSKDLDYTKEFPLRLTVR